MEKREAQRQPGAACVPIRSDALFITRFYLHPSFNFHGVFNPTVFNLFAASPGESLEIRKKKGGGGGGERKCHNLVPVNIKDRISLVVRRTTR